MSCPRNTLWIKRAVGVILVRRWYTSSSYLLYASLLRHSGIIPITQVCLFHPHNNQSTDFIGIGQINPAAWISDEHRPVFIMSGAVALMYIADRTGFWFKEQKQFDPWFFGSLSLLALLAGLGTVKRADKDLGFLNREQTDEWKGWMQSEYLDRYIQVIFELMSLLYSRHLNLPLHWRLKDFRGIQPHTCLGRRVPLHDGVWAHCVLRQKGGLWFPSRRTGEYFGSV